MPTTRRWPPHTRFRIPPAAARSAWAAVPRTAKASHDENGAAAAFDPQALPVNAPGLSFNARGAADLLLQSDFAGAVAATIFAVVIIGFALEGLLCEADRWNCERGQQQADVTQEGANCHELSPIKIKPRATPQDTLSKPGVEGAVGGRSVPQPERN